MSEYREPKVFKPFTYIEMVRPIPTNDPDLLKFRISTLVKTPSGYSLKKNIVRRDENNKIQKILLEFKETRKFQEGRVMNQQEFFFEHVIRKNELSGNIDKGIPVHVIAPHSKSGRPIFHDGSSFPHPKDGD